MRPPLMVAARRVGDRPAAGFRLVYELGRGLVRESTARVTLAWAVNRIEDRNGNFATVEYARTEGDQAGLWFVDIRPSVIRYSPNRRVEFVWEPQPRLDPVDGFAAGVHTRLVHRQQAAAMYGGPQGDTAAKLREYRLSYSNASVRGRRQRVGLWCRV